MRCARTPPASLWGWISCSPAVRRLPPCRVPPRCCNVCRRQGRRARHRQRSCLAGRGTARRSVGPRTVPSRKSANRWRWRSTASWPRVRFTIPTLPHWRSKQARGDLIEAIFLIRAYRTTLPRLGNSRPVETAVMACDRRISATFKDLPGGQILGPTFDYTHRLLDFKLAAEGAPPQDSAPTPPRGGRCAPCHRLSKPRGPDRRGPRR